MAVVADAGGDDGDCIMLTSDDDNDDEDGHATEVSDTDECPDLVEVTADMILQWYCLGVPMVLLRLIHAITRSVEASM